MFFLLNHNISISHFQVEIYLYLTLPLKIHLTVAVCICHLKLLLDLSWLHVAVFIFCHSKPILDLPLAAAVFIFCHSKPILDLPLAVAVFCSVISLHPSLVQACTCIINEMYSKNQELHYKNSNKCYIAGTTSLLMDTKQERMFPISPLHSDL